jgi:hypothetical protein
VRGSDAQICDGVGTLVHSATLADVSLEGFMHDQVSSALHCTRLWRNTIWVITETSQIMLFE